MFSSILPELLHLSLQSVTKSTITFIVIVVYLFFVFIRLLVSLYKFILV